MTDDAKRLLKMAQDCHCYSECKFCPHDENCRGSLDVIWQISELIDELYDQLEQVTRERDAVVSGLREIYKIVGSGKHD